MILMPKLFLKRSTRHTPFFPMKPSAPTMTDMETQAVLPVLVPLQAMLICPIFLAEALAASAIFSIHSLEEGRATAVRIHGRAARIWPYISPLLLRKPLVVRIKQSPTTGCLPVMTATDPAWQKEDI